MSASLDSLDWKDLWQTQGTDLDTTVNDRLSDDGNIVKPCMRCPTAISRSLDFPRDGEATSKITGSSAKSCQHSLRPIESLLPTGVISTFPWERRDVGKVPHIGVWVSRQVLRETVSATGLEISSFEISEANLRSSLHRRA